MGFTDVAGLTEEKREVMEFVEFLKNPEKYIKFGARMPKGALLAGAPGTGKTLLAKAIAGEAGVPFFSVSGSDFMEMFAGVGSSRVRSLFKQAKAAAPAIVFIDEIDAIGGKRGSLGNDERESTLNQLLVEMDGMGTDNGVIVLASTNRADMLDQALVRPGRFDRQIDVQKPDIAGRIAIFKIHLKPLKLRDNLGLDQVAQRMAALTPGMAGSDIANVCNEAAIFAVRRDAHAVDMEDFERATERVLAGLPKSSALVNEATKRVVAVHESGHAVAGWFLKHTDPLLKVTIVPHSKGAMGFAQYLPVDDSFLSVKKIQDRMALALGGRAAEELFIGTVSSGARDDLSKVTEMAYTMVSKFGMNKDLGLVSFNEGEWEANPYGEETGNLIDREVRSIVKSQYDRVKKLLSDRKDILLTLADQLQDKETLLFADLSGIMGERPHGLQDEYRKLVNQANPFSISAQRL